MSNFILGVATQLGRRLSDYTAVNNHARAVLQTLSGPVYVESAYRSIRVVDIGDGKGALGSRVDLLNVIVNNICCERMEPKYVSDPDQCEHCKSIFKPAGKVAAVKNTWLTEDDFITKVSPLLTTDAMTAILWAQELYVFLEYYYGEKPK